MRQNAMRKAVFLIVKHGLSHNHMRPFTEKGDAIKNGGIQPFRVHFILSTGAMSLSFTGKTASSPAAVRLNATLP